MSALDAGLALHGSNIAPTAEAIDEAACCIGTIEVLVDNTGSIWPPAVATVDAVDAPRERLSLTIPRWAGVASWRRPALVFLSEVGRHISEECRVVGGAISA
ncbi:MAG: hypothetical protein WA825_13000 [Steroidobacteraceae bacterium]